MCATSWSVAWRWKPSPKSLGMAEDPHVLGWVIHQTEQRQAWLRLSYAERLAWLVAAKDFASRAKLAAQERRFELKKPPHSGA